MISAKEHVKFSRLNFLFQGIGESFLKVRDLGVMAKRFVYGEEPMKIAAKEKGKKDMEEARSFVSETESLIQICPKLKEKESDVFKEVHDFSLESGFPMATILMTERDVCRKCGKKLLVEDKRSPVVFYDDNRGTYLGCRVVKFCRGCRIYEHYGFWTMNGERQFEVETALESEYLLSSEETAFNMKILRMYSSLLIIGAVPFSTFSSSYNRSHGYEEPKDDEEKGEGRAFKRLKSSGFALESEDDGTIMENGVKRTIVCGTEKGKQKAKNHRTAGILVIEKPCSVVVDVVELFGSESKTQVYAHLHNVLEKEFMQDTKVICYDDACHLKKFAQNGIQSNKTRTSAKMSEMEMVCDRFHFKNHVDSWCRRHCNPNKCSLLENVNTEVCEQLFSWLSRFSCMTKHMNRWRFLFIMLYVLENHNEDVTNRA